MSPFSKLKTWQHERQKMLSDRLFNKVANPDYWHEEAKKINGVNKTKISSKTDRALLNTFILDMNNYIRSNSLSSIEVKKLNFIIKEHPERITAMIRGIENKENRVSSNGIEIKFSRMDLIRELIGEK